MPATTLAKECLIVASLCASVNADICFDGCMCDCWFTHVGGPCGPCLGVFLWPVVAITLCCCWCGYSRRRQQQQQADNMLAVLAAVQQPQQTHQPMVTPGEQSHGQPTVCSQSQTMQPPVPVTSNQAVQPA